MPMEPVHAQPTREFTAERRELIRSGADVCRRDPALWSTSVRYCDALVTQGVDPDEAHELTLQAAGA